MIVYTIPLYAYCFGRAITMYNITIGLEPLTILTLMTKVTVLPLRKHNVWSLSLTLLMNSVGVSSSLVTSVSRLLFKHQHLNASPYGFAGVYRQCRCVITVCTRKSPACHKVCNFNKIYCPFFRFNINKDNVHKSIIS